MPEPTVMPEPTTCAKPEQQALQPGRTYPSVYMACDRVVSKGRSYCPYYYPARCVFYPPVKRTQQRHAQLQDPGAFTEPMQRPHYWPEDHCRILVWSWVEHQTQSPTLVLKRQLT